MQDDAEISSSLHTMITRYALKFFVPSWQTGWQNEEPQVSKAPTWQINQHPRSLGASTKTKKKGWRFVTDKMFVHMHMHSIYPAQQSFINNLKQSIHIDRYMYGKPNAIQKKEMIMIIKNNGTCMLYSWQV